MITGVVNADLEATIRLEVLGTGGQSQTVEAVVDTGYNGFFTLPPGLIASLGLPWLCRQPGMLADGSVQVFNVHIATVLWDGQPRQVETDEADAQPLIGMRLLQGHEIKMHIIDGGVVSVSAVPPP
jgi:clan AA aspartic protease